MRLRICRLLQPIAAWSIVGLLLLSTALPVFAIADPTTQLLNTVTAYQDLMETDDVLFLVDFTVDYVPAPPPPTEMIGDAFLVILIAVDGVTHIRATSPYTYSNGANGYGRGAASIYFSASDAATLLTWGAAYTVRLVGNPVLAWPGAPPEVVKAVSWYPHDGTVNNQTAVAESVIGIARAIELDWGGATDFLADTSLGLRLNTAGESYFVNAIPNLRDMAPDAFSAGSVDPIREDIDYSTVGGGTLTNGTGTATGSPITLVEGVNTVVVTVAGTFTIIMNPRNTGVVTNGTGVVDLAPVTLEVGTNTINVPGGGTGTIIVTMAISNTATDAIAGLLGTPLDMTVLATQLGTTRSMISAILWLIGTGIMLYFVVRYLGTKMAMPFFGVLVIVGGLLGMVPLLLVVGLAIGAGVLTGLVWFYNKSSA